MWDLGATYNSATVMLAQNMSYNPFGGPKGMNTGSGGEVENQSGECDCIEAVNPGSMMEQRYTYDKNRNLLSITAPNTPWYNQTFRYDTLNRLTGAEGRYGSVSYTYDKVGNRLSRNLNGDIENYTYQAGTNTLTGITGANPLNYTHDANGNITGMGTKTLIYNQNNRLIRVEENGTPLGEYAYNALGQRVKKNANGAITIFHYDTEGNIIAEGAPDGTITKEYLYMGQIRMAMVDVTTQSFYYFLNDRLGTPQIMTDNTGTVVWEGSYKPFGEAAVHPDATVVNNLRFPGQYQDSETGFHYNYHRYYDPTMGRYLTPDPFGQVGGINLFSYVNNNPILAADPLGLWKSSGHTDLTQKAISYFDGRFKGTDIAIIIAANTGVDINNPFEDAAHYMPGTSQKADAIISRFMDIAIRMEIMGHHDYAMQILGAGLHTLQDKYAHCEQNAGWGAHFDYYLNRGSDPDDPLAHPEEYMRASQASINYINIFLEKVSQNKK